MGGGSWDDFCLDHEKDRISNSTNSDFGDAFFPVPVWGRKSPRVVVSDVQVPKGLEMYGLSPHLSVKLEIIEKETAGNCPWQYVSSFIYSVS